MFSGASSIWYDLHRHSETNYRHRRKMRLHLSGRSARADTYGRNQDTNSYWAERGERRAVVLCLIEHDHFGGKHASPERTLAAPSLANPISPSRSPPALQQGPLWSSGRNLNFVAIVVEHAAAPSLHQVCDRLQAKGGKE